MRYLFVVIIIVCYLLFFEYYSDEFVEMLKKRLKKLEEENPDYMEGL